MKIDTLITGTEIVSAKPKFLYENGESTNVQDSIDGVPLWSVEVAVKDGVYVLPVRVRVPSATEPKGGLSGRFVGLEVTTFSGKIFYSAEKIEPIDEPIDGLANLFEEE